MKAHFEAKEQVRWLVGVLSSGLLTVTLWFVCGISLDLVNIITVV